MATRGLLKEKLDVLNGWLSKGITMTVDDWAAVDRIAKTKGINRSQFIRNCVQKILEKEYKKWYKQI